MEDELEQFFSENDNKHADKQPGEKVTKAKKTKKRKPEPDAGTTNATSEETSEETELRKRARFYCKSPEQWRAVSKYAPKRLEEFCQEKDFEAKKEFQTSFFDSVHQGLAMGLDRLSSADGHVREQILSDVSLRDAIEKEGADFVGFLNNKIKITLLTLLGVANGKRKQFANGPRRHNQVDVSARIEEVGDGSCGGEQTAQEETGGEASDRPNLS